MKNVILVHGCCDKEEFLSEKYPSGSNSHWFPWIQKQLNIADIESQTPEMPSPYKPVYQDWKRVFEQFSVNEDTILVGHSCGAGFLLRWLGEEKNKVAKLILVAPYFDPRRESKVREDLVDFEIDSSIQNRTDIHILYSSDDSVPGVKESMDILSKILPDAHQHLFKDKGHFTFGDMKTEEFPELRDALLK